MGEIEEAGKIVGAKGAAATGAGAPAGAAATGATGATGDIAAAVGSVALGASFSCQERSKKLRRRCMDNHN